MSAALREESPAGGGEAESGCIESLSLTNGGLQHLPVGVYLLENLLPGLGGQLQQDGKTKKNDGFQTSAEQLIFPRSG